MTKVIVNNAYAGLGLSAKAIKRYYEIKHPEVKLYAYKGRFLGNLNKISLEDVEGECELFTKDMGEVPSFDEIDWSCWVTEVDCERHDPTLVQIVEELGNEANREGAHLEIVTIDSDRYVILESDGFEIIKTPETIKWIYV